MMNTKLPYRVSVTGPEATGKSILAEDLAKYYNTSWVPEYARQYLSGRQGGYEYNDLLKIARGQYEAEELAAEEAGRFLFCDTDMLVMYIWSMDKFRKCDPWILEKLEEDRYDFYLLCDTALPWVPDPLREDPLRRDELFRLYYKELKNRTFRFGIVSGTGKARTANAIKLIEEALG